MNKIHIATAATRRSAKWKNTQMGWLDFVAKLRSPAVTNETVRQFAGASREERSQIKDSGGYFGGYLRGGRRKKGHVLARQVVTLDLDYADLTFVEDFQSLFTCEAVIHSSHSHTPESPRLRLIVPLSREVSAEEYEAVARWVADELDIELFDPTTFQPERFMYWPSHPKDAQFVYHHQEGEWLSPDAVLGNYKDWQDVSAWPRHSMEAERVERDTKKQQDPHEKEGLIGAFCRTYSIEEAIAQFLEGIYEEAQEGRYTFTGGSTAMGVVVYDGKFSYSHHATDPAGDQLVNAWDLVRLHKFGYLDDRENSKKSHQAMEAFCLKDEATRRTLAVERLEAARTEFGDTFDLAESESGGVDVDWLADLELDLDSKGQVKSSAGNISKLLAHDPNLKGLFALNQFSNKPYMMRSAPWRRIAEAEPVRNVDFAGVRNYLEAVHGVSGNYKVEDSLTLEIEKNAFHPIREYLEALRWDGVSRVDNLLIDYFGAEDNVYSKEAIRKMLVGAVARVFEPGCKFDLVLTLVGEQGIGKSTLASRLGGKWFSDSFYTVQGKEALEQVQGAWIIEMAELSGLRKAEVEPIKHFISKQEDTFRPAYARTSETFPRQCVFFGTTNTRDFLRDPSGNRRFMPVDTKPQNATKSIFQLSKSDVDQIWAEALSLYELGEKLYLSEEAQQLAAIEQHKHSETDERLGMLEDYLNTLLPEDWESRGALERLAYFTDEFEADSLGVVERDAVCVAEVHMECFGGDRKTLDRYKSREINDLLRSLPGWRQMRTTRRFGPYGSQKFFERIKEE